MVVGIGHLVLRLPGNTSLKGKRKVVRSLVDKLRARFNAAVAEVSDLDNLRTATLGISVVSNEAAHANAQLDAVFDFAERHPDAIVAARTLELVHVNGREMGWSSYEDLD